MRYKCLCCGEIYDKEEVALNCCYDSDNVYQCEICQEVWNYRWQANDCCKEQKVEEIEECNIDARRVGRHMGIDIQQFIAAMYQMK